MALSNKGLILINLKRYDEALQNIDKALELQPDLAEAWINKGITLKFLGRYEEALNTYDKAIKFQPDLPYAWYNKAGIYALKTDKPNTLFNLSKAIEISSEAKERAKKDADFISFWNDEEFKKIVG